MKGSKLAMLRSDKLTFYMEIPFQNEANDEIVVH